MRCPDCGKFVPFENQEPEVVQEDVTDEGQISITAHIVRACGECSTELQEGNIDMESDCSVDVEKHRKEHPACEKSDLTLDVGSAELTERTEGKGRGLRTFIGARVEAAIKCGECDAEIVSVVLEDDMQASSFDDMV